MGFVYMQIAKQDQETMRQKLAYMWSVSASFGSYLSFFVSADHFYEADLGICVNWRTQKIRPVLQVVTATPSSHIHHD